MHVHRDSSHVRSARTTWSAFDGSVNSIHSRGKSNGVSRVRGSSSVIITGAGTSSRRRVWRVFIGIAYAERLVIKPTPLTPRLRRVRLGVLDVGSNTVHLLVVDAHRGAHPTPMHSEKSVLRLAERITRGGELSNAVQAAKEAAARLGCEEVMAFATSAVREAKNSAKVLARVAEETGVDLQVLSGVDEARHTFLAVRRWYGWSSGQLLVLDIGGGSLEIAMGRDEEPVLAESLPLGAGRT